MFVIDLKCFNASDSFSEWSLLDFTPIPLVVFSQRCQFAKPEANSQTACEMITVMMLKFQVPATWTPILMNLIDLFLDIQYDETRITFMKWNPDVNEQAFLLNPFSNWRHM